MKKLFFIMYFGIISLGLFSQRPTMEMTFTAADSTAYVQLDSIKIMNRTQGCDTVLYWPDSVLSIYNVGIPESSVSTKGFQVFQNYPNPVNDQTNISIYIPSKDKVNLIVTDLLGRVVLISYIELNQGIHFFRLILGNGNLYFFTALWKGQNSSIKVLNLSSRDNNVSLEYLGAETSTRTLKVTEEVQGFLFSFGDELLYIGYVDTSESGMQDTPEESETYIFQFATNIPCLGIPTVEYAGQVYNTIQIRNQCWLKENLNVGTTIIGDQEMTDNGIIEKYCYHNENSNCEIYGGLYQWWEVMQYTTQQGAQGICPTGWHVPTDEEWKVLEGVADSQYYIGADTLEYTGFRGFDCGINLKSVSGWYHNYGTDLYGFTGLPGGYCLPNYGSFGSLGYLGYWWSSTVNYSEAWSRFLDFMYPGVGRHSRYIEGFSVRCIQD